jgi:hypothetical protein
MFGQTIWGLLAIAQVAAQSTQPGAAQPCAGCTAPAPNPAPAIDLRAITQGVANAKRVPVENKCQAESGGAALGTVLGVAGGLLPGGAGMLIGAIPVTSLLTGQLLKILDCKEQKQAATATNEAIRGGVGSQASWKSESRKNVSGTSKVTGQQQLASGALCMMVTDVVIVEGEETTVAKKMCRAPGATAFVAA